LRFRISPPRRITGTIFSMFFKQYNNLAKRSHSLLRSIAETAGSKSSFLNRLINYFGVAFLYFC
ncbi:MAG: hypothetical protein AB8G22_03335, partial [Saprospiraceae bacterium]